MVPSPTGAPPHSLPNSTVHWGSVAGPSPPSTGVPWHRQGFVMAGHVLAAEPWIGGGMNWYFPKERCAGEGCGHYLHPLPNYMALAPQTRHAVFGKPPGSHCCWRPLTVLSTRSVCLLGGHATVSIWYVTRGVPGHGVPQPQPDPSHQGVPRGSAPVVGDTLNLPLCLPQVSTSWTSCLAPSHPPGRQGQLVGFIYPGIPFWAILG